MVYLGKTPQSYGSFLPPAGRKHVYWFSSGEIHRTKIGIWYRGSWHMTLSSKRMSWVQKNSQNYKQLLCMFNDTWIISSPLSLKNSLQCTTTAWFWVHSYFKSHAPTFQELQENICPKVLRTEKTRVFALPKVFLWLMFSLKKPENSASKCLE